MAKEIIMPKAGMDMKEGVIVRWLAQVGDRVGAGDALLEIETDKVTMEVESPADGTLLCRYYSDGDTVPVVTVIGYVGEQGEKIPDAPSAATVAAPQAAPPAPAAKPSAVPSGQDSYDWDVAVIGGGPAGYVAAIRAAQLGGRIVLFEKDAVGGTCLNRGCIPTKTHMKNAEYIQNIRRAGERGISVDCSALAVDMPRICGYKRKVVETLTGGVAGLLKSHGVKTVKGTASLEDAHTISCAGDLYSAKSVILCGGSVPGKLPVPGADHPRVLSSDSILELEELPASLAVLGGGVIGCEIATAFAAYGSKVTVIELTERILPMMDREISEEIAKSMEKAGVTLLTDRSLERIEPDGQGLGLLLSGGERLSADYLLISAGRQPDTTCLGKLAERLETVRGRIKVDEYCRTGIPGVYACGDITSAASLAHAAFAMGEAAAENAMGKSVAVNLRAVPSCLYTLPEAAGVGLTEQEAAAGGPILTGRFPFAFNGRAIASGEPEGFVKVIAEPEFGEILGVQIVGAYATEMIAEAKALIDMEITIHEAAGIIHAHPTFSEALMEACRDALDSCAHLPKKQKPRAAGNG